MLRQSIVLKCLVTLSFPFLFLYIGVPTLFGQQATAAQANSPTANERWDVLSLRGNNLHALAPQFGEKDVLPQFTREMIRLEWRYQDPIDVFVIRPNGVVKPPVVLFLYGYPTDTDRFFDDTLCANLTRDGFAAVGFVSALTGERYHDRPMKEWFVSELQESLGTSVHDVQMVLNYLETRGDLDMSRVGMFGQGSGGTIAILSTAVDPRIKATDVLNPWGDWPNWLAKSPQVPDSERAQYLTPAFLAKVAPLDPVRSLPALNGRPVRLEETSFTYATPVEARKTLVEALPPDAVLVRYRDRDQYLQEAGTNGKILDWIHDALKTR